GTLSTQGIRSIVSTVSISPEGFLPSILLVVVIIVTVVIVTVILVVVVVAIVGVNYALLSDPLALRLCDPIACSIPIGWAYAFHQDKASSVRVPVENVTLSSSAYLLRENTDSFDLTGDENPTDEDGDIEIGDSTEVSVSFGDEIFSKGLRKMFPGEAGK
ncbi:hypothetical protein Tco_0950729, partial [Tanacetum coccineum]